MDHSVDAAELSVVAEGNGSIFEEYQPALNRNEYS